MSDNRKITISSSRMAEHNALRLMGRGSPALRPETIAVRAGAEIDPDTGALSPPLHLVRARPRKRGHPRIPLHTGKESNAVAA